MQQSLADSAKELDRQAMVRRSLESDNRALAVRADEISWRSHAGEEVDKATWATHSRGMDAGYASLGLGRGPRTRLIQGYERGPLPPWPVVA